ncbi:MAG: site-specific DNA-methyltransferase [Candidatus Aureabacteria bacterium]|nr:site-specific DNA-methyltransferase [Candidatus Auribacterota bacterium]
MNNKQKLELTWIGKENRPKLEPRILVEDPAKSHHALFRTGKSDLFDNRLIFGDNLLALKALEQEFAGKIKCVFIDPPYNTGSAFKQYDDGIEHSLWLSLMRDRLELVHRLLAVDGSLWMTIDDNECHYLKVLCDEVFGRQHFVANAIWQKKFSPQNDAKWLSDSHDHILVFAKNKEIWRPFPLPRTDEMNARYKNPDNDPRGKWMSGGLDVKTYSAEYDYSITTPSGRIVNPPGGSCWRLSKQRLEEYKKDNRIWFGPKGTNVPRIKRFLSEVKQGAVCKTIWLHEEVGHNQDAKKEAIAFNTEDVFSTPKPERLLQRILELGSRPGDLVLDSFAGSGTTGAVAHKMGRRWIMVELGEHCHTHIIPRLKKVIDGEDKGGITGAVGWKGGGGFRYYRLGPSLLEKDQFGNWVISKEYNPAMLAEAICKLEGFSYAPSETVYWQHGHSTENDFIYVTTQTLTREQLQKLSDEVGEGRSLLIMCGAFRVKSLDDFPNLTVKKIPKAVLTRCEWGKDDYSLEIENLPIREEPPIAQMTADEQKKKTRTKAERRAQIQQPSLFDLPPQEKKP